MNKNLKAQLNFTFPDTFANILYRLYIYTDKRKCCDLLEESGRL